jgi:small conductance mechanosensitive channel
VLQAVQEPLDAVQAPLQLVRERLVDWAEALVRNLPNVVVALFVLFVGWVLARSVRGVVNRWVVRHTSNPDLTRLAATFASFFVILAAGLVALSVLNLERTVTTMLAGAGVVGLAIGFAFQDTAANLISGVAMAMRKPFLEGDLVEVGTDLAIVERIELRTTSFRRLDGPTLLLPNKSVFQNRIVNYSSGRGRRIELGVGVSYGDDLGVARDAAIGAVKSLQAVDSRREVAFYWTGFGSSSIDGILHFWIQEESMGPFLAARSEAVGAIKRAFDSAGITIPFPIRTLDFPEGAGWSAPPDH